MDPMDGYIGRQIKHSVARSRPPASVKTRLLHAATHPAPATLPKYQTPLQINKPEKDWSHGIFDWAVMGNTGMGAVNMRVLL